MLPIIANIELDGRPAIVRAPSFRLGRAVEKLSKRYRDGETDAAWDLIETVVPACVTWADGSPVDLDALSAEAAATAARLAITGGDGGADPTPPRTTSACVDSDSTPPQSR